MAKKKKTQAEKIQEDNDRWDALREQMFGKWDGEYIGNIWGWKVSIFAFFFLAALSILVIIGHKRGHIDAFNPDGNSPRQEIVNDSLNQDTLSQE